MLIASKRNGPTLIRYPRGSIPPENFVEGNQNQSIVKISDGEKWAVLSYGASVPVMLKVKKLAERDKNLNVPALYDVRRIKPLDFEILDGILNTKKLVVVLEESYMPGGLGEAVAARISEGSYSPRLLHLGVPDVCVTHATQDEQRELYGLTAENIIHEAKKFLSSQHEDR